MPTSRPSRWDRTPRSVSHSRRGSTRRRGRRRGVGVRAPEPVRRRRRPGPRADHGSSSTPTGAVADGAQLVLLREATDERFVRAALDELADSTFVIKGDGTNRWRSAKLRDAVARLGRGGRPGARRRADPPRGPARVFEVFASVTPEPARGGSLVAGRRRRRPLGDHRDGGAQPARPRGAPGLPRAGAQPRRGPHHRDGAERGRPRAAVAHRGGAGGHRRHRPGRPVRLPQPGGPALLGPEVRSFGDLDWLDLADPSTDGPPGALDAALHDASRADHHRRLHRRRPGPTRGCASASSPSRPPTAGPRASSSPSRTSPSRSPPAPRWPPPRSACGSWPPTTRSPASPTGRPSTTSSNGRAPPRAAAAAPERAVLRPRRVQAGERPPRPRRRRRRAGGGGPPPAGRRCGRPTSWPASVATSSWCSARPGESRRRSRRASSSSASTPTSASRSWWAARR